MIKTAGGTDSVTDVVAVEAEGEDEVAVGGREVAKEVEVEDRIGGMRRMTGATDTEIATGTATEISDTLTIPSSKKNLQMRTIAIIIIMKGKDKDIATDRRDLHTHNRSHSCDE